MKKMHMKLAILFVLLTVVASSSPFDWLKFKRDFNKHYKSAAEEEERKLIYFENANRIRTYERTHPNATFKLGVNHLADRRIDEIVSGSKYYVEPTESMPASIDLSSFPDSLDWRTKGVISPVKDQGSTGYVAAMVAVEVIETLYAIETSKLITGSVARVEDCCPQTLQPFHCIKKLGGICAAADYPSPIGTCIRDKCKPFATFDTIKQLKNNNENTMVAWIQNSTLYVGVDASQSSFQFYQSGIYADATCSKTTIDHVMQLVGYGKTASGDLFWICRNSWGVSWGEQGYIRILRGKNTCGIASYVFQIA